MSGGFGERVRAALAASGPLCVGVDPHPALLSAWGLDHDGAGVREFGLRAVDAAAGRAAFVKPQVSFFERFGSAGFAALEEVLRTAREAGLIVIADAKRGDIGSTMDAYAAAWFGGDSALEADALTVNPFLGVGALESTFTLAAEAGKGVFVLAATSNPEAESLQRAVTASGSNVSASIMEVVSSRNARTVPAGHWGDIGFVVGATVEWSDAGIATFFPPAPILAPGFGTQGARPEELRARFGAAAEWVIASESRSILSAGPDGVATAIAERQAQYREALRG